MRRLRLRSHSSDDPLDGMANLFDLGVVFALGFGIAVLAQVSAQSPEAAKHALQGKPAAQEERVPDRTLPMERYRSTDETLGGRGTRLGTAYKLANGDIVYVPEAPQAPASGAR